MKLLFLIFSIVIGKAAIAQHEVSCPFTAINTHITVNTTLSATTIYRLEGCIHVRPGISLTIPAGTIILMQKLSTAGLVIDTGAYLIAQGTVARPIVFTSDQLPAYRNPGDGSGLIINGLATNNAASGNSTPPWVCSSYAGGKNDLDSSGIIKFVRVEFAKTVLSSLGSRTILENIQVSYSPGNGIEFLGGTARAKRLISLNAKENDFVFSMGSRAKVQAALGLRFDPAAYAPASPFSNGILIKNNDNIAVSYTGIPATRPILDKITLLGPSYCSTTSPGSNFLNAFLLQHNAKAGIYNSISSSWPVGLKLEDASTLSNATSTPPSLHFEANTLDNHTTYYNNTPSWPAATCAPSSYNWINGIGSCAQQFNEFSPGSLGYDASVCADFCNNKIPSFLMSGSQTGDTYYTGNGELQSDPFFSTSSFRGAFDQTTDWTKQWTEFCPQHSVYCTGSAKNPLSKSTNQATTTHNNGDLIVMPNPANAIVHAEFITGQAGMIHITVVNSTGQVVYNLNQEAEKGKQKVTLYTDGFSNGLYTINITLPEGNTVHSSIVVSK